MKPVDTGKAYDQIAHRWDGDPFNRDNGIPQHERALAFAKNTGTALDVGCGASGRFIDLLLGKGYAVEGVDVSAKMLNLAKQRHPGVSFYLEDVCEWDLPRTYDFITAWDSIWHVPLTQHEPLLRKLIAALNPDGILVFSCGGTDEQDELRDDYMGPEVYYSSLGINAYFELFASVGGICRHFEYDQYPELHSYFIVQKRSD